MFISCVYLGSVRIGIEKVDDMSIGYGVQRRNSINKEKIMKRLWVKEGKGKWFINVIIFWIIGR